MDISGNFTKFRQFMINEPDDAEQAIFETVNNLQLKDKVKIQLLKFSLQQLPMETLGDCKTYLVETAINLLVTHRTTIVQAVSHVSDEATRAMTNSLLQLDYSQLLAKWLPGFKKDVARFIYTYLHKELENLLGKALPAISLNTVIVEKIDQFSARQLEETIQRICHRELRWLAFLGAFLGFWLGLVSNGISYWWHPATTP